MRAVGGVRRQRQFAIAGQLDAAHALGSVGQRDAADFGVVFGRDHDFGAGFDFGIAAAELGAVGGKRHAIAPLAPRNRLKRVRPHKAFVQVAHVNERAVIVARGVGAPARDVHVAPARIAAAGVCYHQREGAVAQQVDARRRRVRRLEFVHRRAGRNRFQTRRGTFRHGVVEQRRRGRHRFIQQRSRRLHARIGMKTVLHDAGMEQVVEGEQTHALMMHHEGANQNAAFALRRAGAREINGFVEAVTAARADALQALEVRYRRDGIDQQRQRRRIGSDHQVIVQPALQSQPRHAERLILIGFSGVQRGVGGFGNAPGNAALPAISHLARDGGAAGVIEQRVFVGARQQQRHQVFKHGAAP